MQRVVEKIFFALIRFEINGTDIDDDIKNSITPEVLPALFHLSKKHDLAHLIGDALDKNSLLPDGLGIKEYFLQERDVAMFRYTQAQYELEQISEILEKAQIPFIPLKGSVAQLFYPEAWMRTSCDIDVLVDRENLVRAQQCLQSHLEYHLENAESSHDVSLYAPSGVHLELHYSLEEGEYTQGSSDILSGVWGNITDSSSYQKSMTNAMFYFYHIAHMAKHFEVGGCGIRPFLDVYLLKRSGRYDFDACYELLKKGGLLTFSKAVEETAAVWFGDALETTLVQDVQNYILYAGMYADVQNRAAVRYAKRGGIKYFWSRVFLSYEQLKMQYPNLEKRKLLLPFYQVKRWCRLLLGKDAKNVARELKANIRLQSDKKEYITKLLKDLGL